MGLIDHNGIGVPDLVAAKQYFDGFMPMVGFVEWFPSDEFQFNYGPKDQGGTQIFFYRALEPAGYSRHGIGLQHLSFNVPTRGSVDAAHEWAIDHSATVIHEPRQFPEYGERTYATYFLDPNGIMLEVVCHAQPE